MNKKLIKKTLDMRKLEIARKRELKEWDRQPKKVFAKRINIRRLKMRVKRRL